MAPLSAAAVPPSPVRMRVARLTLALLVFAFVTGTTSGDAADPGGTVVIAVGADPDILLPPLTNTSTGRLVADQIFERLAELPASGVTSDEAGYQPRLAQRWTWARDRLSLAFHLNPRARWHDGRPVRAQDVAFSFRISKDSTTGSTISAALRRIDSVTVRDPLTAVFWFSQRYPNQFFDATYQVFIVPEHHFRDASLTTLRSHPFGRRPVGSGRFRFVSWQPNQRLELIADTLNYRGRPLLDRLILSVAPDYNGALARVLSGEADFLELVRAPNIAEIAGQRHLQLQPYPNLQYAFLLFNQREKGTTPHPLFSDVNIRRAVAMSLDRPALVRNVMDSLGKAGIGPAPRGLPTSDSTVRQPPYDPAGARRLLDSLGWRPGEDGVRMKDGRPLRFTLIAPTSSQNRVRMATLIQEALRQVGIRVDVEQMDQNAMSARLRARDFDAVMQALATDPVPDAILQSWGTASIPRGGNYGAYSNPAFDALIDSGAATSNPRRARAYLRRAYQTILNDVPAVWLYEPVLLAAKHRRIRTPNMRVDAWWVGLPEWHIPPSERIARDRIGLRRAR
jgi:peptide/nickel transport system substrate-binding protein